MSDTRTSTAVALTVLVSAALAVAVVYWSPREHELAERNSSQPISEPPVSAQVEAPARRAPDETERSSASTNRSSAAASAVARGTLRGHVLVDGAPPTERVRLSWESFGGTPSPRGELETDARGSFVLEEAPSGTFAFVPLEPHRWADTEYDEVVQKGERRWLEIDFDPSERREIEFRLTGLSFLSGRAVVSDTGEPLVSGTVRSGFSLRYVESRSFGLSTHRSEGSGTETSLGTDGTWRLALDAPGIQEVEVHIHPSTKDLGEASKRVTLAELPRKQNGDYDLGAIEVPIAHLVKVRVRDPKGTPINAASIASSTRGYRESAISDADGLAELWLTDPLPHSLDVSAEGYWWRQVDVSPRDILLDVTLDPANEVIWRISLPNSEPTRPIGMELSVSLPCAYLNTGRDTAGQLLSDRGTEPRAKLAPAPRVSNSMSSSGSNDGQGNCTRSWQFEHRTLTVTGFRPGVALPWELREHGDGSPTLSSGVIPSLGAAERRVVDVRLDKAALTITGRVLDLAGNPLQAIIGVDSGAYRSMRSRPDGSFAVTFLNDEADLSVFAAGYQPFRAKAQALESSDGPVEIVLQPAMPVRIRLRNEAGAAVSNAEVRLRAVGTQEGASGIGLGNGIYEVSGVGLGPALIEIRIGSTFFRRNVDVDRDTVEVSIPALVPVRFDWTLPPETDVQTPEIVMLPAGQSTIISRDTSPFMIAGVSLDARTQRSGQVEMLAVPGPYLVLLEGLGEPGFRIGPLEVVIPPEGGRVIALGP